MEVVRVTTLPSGPEFTGAGSHTGRPPDRPTSAPPRCPAAPPFPQEPDTTDGEPEPEPRDAIPEWEPSQPGREAQGAESDEGTPRVAGSPRRRRRRPDECRGARRGARDGGRRGKPQCRAD